MAANVLSRLLRLKIGSDEQDWSLGIGEFTGGNDGISLSGIIAFTGTIQIFQVLGLPENINPRLNPSRFRQGQIINIEVWNGSIWKQHPRGSLRILVDPAPANGGEPLTISVGCWLAYAAGLQPDDDQSGVEVGAGQNTAAVATRLLEAAGIPSAAINLGTWTNTINWPLQKDSGGGFVGQAGNLAYADGHRFIYTDPNGIIRSQQLSMNPAVAADLTVTLGVNDVTDFLPTQDPFTPVENVRVSGQGYEVVVTENNQVASTSVTEPASNYREDATGSVTTTTEVRRSYGDPGSTTPDFDIGVGTTPINDAFGKYWILDKIVITQPAAAIIPGSDSLSPRLTVETTCHIYNEGNKRLEKVIKNFRTPVRQWAPNSATLGRGDRERTTTNFVYNSNEVIVEINELGETVNPVLTGVEDSVTNTRLEDSKRARTQWEEVYPGSWTQRSTSSSAVGQNSDGGLRPTALRADKPTVSQNSSPPSTEFWPDPSQLKEKHYTGEAAWVHPGGATGLNRYSLLTVEPGFSNALCEQIAQTEVLLFEGRRLGHLIPLEITNALLDSNKPILRIDVVAAEGTYKFIGDTLSFAHTQISASALVNGIWLDGVY